MVIIAASAPRDRDRFAPSPTGPLYLGSLLATFGNWLLARAEWLVHRRPGPGL